MNTLESRDVPPPRAEVRLLLLASVSSVASINSYTFDRWQHRSRYVYSYLAMMKSPEK